MTFRLQQSLSERPCVTRNLPSQRSEPTPPFSFSTTTYRYGETDCDFVSRRRRVTAHLEGVYYYGYRFYNPELARWVNKDPITERGGILLYGFVQNDSVNRWDLYGQTWTPMPGTGIVLPGGPSPGNPGVIDPEPISRERTVTDVDWCCLGKKTVSSLFDIDPTDDPELPSIPGGRIPIPGLAASCAACMIPCGAVCTGTGGSACLYCLASNPACGSCAWGLLSLAIDGAECIETEVKCYKGYKMGIIKKFFWMEDYHPLSGVPICRYHDTNRVIVKPRTGCPHFIRVRGRIKNYVPCPD